MYINMHTKKWIFLIQVNTSGPMAKIAIPWIPIVFIAIPIFGSYIGSLFYRTKDNGWYETLNQPSWRPPNYVFPPVWTTLYLGMGYASYLIYRDGGEFSGAAKIPLVLYATQLVLNWAWPPLFFKFHLLKWSLVEICALWTNVAICVVIFHKINKTASYVMVLYLLWLSFATALMYYLYNHNPDNSNGIMEH